MSTSATDDPVRKSLYRGHSFAYSPRQLRIVWCLWTSADAATATHHVAYGRRLPADRQESASSCHLAKSRERQVDARCRRWRSRSRKAGYDPYVNLDITYKHVNRRAPASSSARG
jgi:hypothetical protein